MDKRWQLLCWAGLGKTSLSRRSYQLSIWKARKPTGRALILRRGNVRQINSRTRAWVVRCSATTFWSRWAQQKEPTEWLASWIWVARVQDTAKLRARQRQAMGRGRQWDWPSTLPAVLKDQARGGSDHHRGGRELCIFWVHDFPYPPYSVFPVLPSAGKVRSKRLGDANPTHWVGIPNHQTGAGKDSPPL